MCEFRTRYGEEIQKARGGTASRASRGQKGQLRLELHPRSASAPADRQAPAAAPAGQPSPRAALAWTVRRGATRRLAALTPPACRGRAALVHPLRQALGARRRGEALLTKVQFPHNLGPLRSPNFLGLAANIYEFWNRHNCIPPHVLPLHDVEFSLNDPKVPAIDRRSSIGQLWPDRF